MDHKFSVSMMCMDLLQLGNQIKELDELADMYHIDIMDGHFVRNITLSPDFTKRVKSVSKLPVDAHLMVEDPWLLLDDLLKIKTDYITVHAETINGSGFRIINKIHEAGSKVGIAINPETPFDYIKHYTEIIDKVLIMTVDPGFAGAPFIPQTVQKIKEAHEWKLLHNCSYTIEVDGACNGNTYGQTAGAGAEMFVLGSTSGIFKYHPELDKAWGMMEEEFKKKVSEYGDGYVL